DSALPTPTNKIEVFDPPNNTWDSITIYIVPRTGHTASVVNGKIYVIGGSTIGNSFATGVDIFDPSANTWSSPITSGLFTPRHNLTSCVLQGQIIVMGGWGETGWLNTVEVFDPVKNVWYTPLLTGTFTPRALATSTLVGGSIYVIGGQ